MAVWVSWVLLGDSRVHPGEAASAIDVSECLSTRLHASSALSGSL